jgi:hypothetical protein
MLVVASRHAITASAPATLVHVVAGVPGLTVVDDALMDRGCPIPLRCGLGMNRGHFLVSRGLHRRLGGKPAAPQGGTLGLLHGHGLEETLNLIVGPSGLGRRWLRHVAEKHSSGDNVLAGLVEDWGFACSVLDDTTIDVVSSLSSSSTTCTRRALPLEGLLKWTQALSFLIELGLQLLNLHELCPLVCFEELGFVPCTRVHAREVV